MRRIAVMILVACVSAILPDEACASGLRLNLGPQEIVQADGADIQVPGYSVPCLADWNSDGLKDLVVGEGGGSGKAKVRIYLNIGTESAPQFGGYFYARVTGTDLTCPASGCMGCFPRVVYWDADVRKDLLIGQADGMVRLFLNIGAEGEPVFDAGAFLQVGKPGSKVIIDVGNRATPSVVDWNNDGRKDLVVGAYDARIHIFINEGTDTEPDFHTETFAQAEGADLVVPGNRASPVVLDLDADGRKDILTGNTDGQLLFYSNVGTDEEPSFSGYWPVESEGVPIDLPGSSRSRPFVCYWTGDGQADAYPDVLIGYGDGKIHLYRGVPMPADLDKDGDVDFVDFALFADYWNQGQSRRSQPEP